MKVQIRKTPEDELIKNYPIKGKTSGWFFKLRETSNGAWKIEGSDVWGRMIGITGINEKDLIESAKAEEARINETIRAS